MSQIADTVLGSAAEKGGLRWLDLWNVRSGNQVEDNTGGGMTTKIPNLRATAVESVDRGSVHAGRRFARVQFTDVTDNSAVIELEFVPDFDSDDGPEFYTLGRVHLRSDGRLFFAPPLSQRA
jgi:hypothetical protein